MTIENDLWNSSLELEYQIGFDRPIFVEDLLPDITPVAADTDKPKTPVLPKLVEKPLVVPPIKQPPVQRKHITKSGK